jgi:hypothetical protein
MYLNKKDIDTIKDILSKFPEVDGFKLEQDNSSGIGSITTIMFDITINGVSGEFAAEIDSVEDW